MTDDPTTTAGAGSAADPTIQTTESGDVATINAADLAGNPDDEEAKAKGKAAIVADAEAAVKAAEAKIAKQQAHLDGANQALEQAKADLEAAKAA